MYVKALHIIFVVTWFAGLFYIVRLFIYQREAQDKEEPEKSILSRQFSIMQRRLWYGITWPSAILTLIFGGWVLYLQPYFLQDAWMHVKLALVAGLYLYHFQCHAIFKAQQKGVFKQSSNRLRIWNEIATLFLVSIVFLVVLKNTLNMLWGLIGLVIFSILLMLAIRIYRKMRK